MKVKFFCLFCILVFFGGFYYVYEQNLDVNFYEDVVLECFNELLQISYLIRNLNLDSYV